MIDIDKAITTAVKTGKVVFGSSITKQNAKEGKGKMIVLASNCPKKTREEIEQLSKVSAIPVVIFRGSALDLGGICGKPFPVSALTVREAGDSDILKLTEVAEPQESLGGFE